MTKYILTIAIVLFFATCKKTDVTPVNSPTQNPNSPSQNIKVPKLTTSNVSNLTSFSVVFSGKVVDSGGSKINQFGIVADTVSMATVKKNFNKFSATQQNIDGTFSVNVSYLPSNVTFYIRAYAINASDTGYGNEVKFTTLAQKIFKGDVNLTTQQQVVDFGSQHYTTINGALNISGTVSDLTPLLGLSTVNNGFNTTGSLLVNFKGLDSLEITGAIFPNDFWVERNRNLIDFSGLSKLKITRGSVQIDNNNSLINLNGLDSYVAASAGTLRIGECPKLQNINGLKNMIFVGDDLYLINNSSLTDISGLASLSTISGRLYVINNPKLQNLNGLGQIKTLPDGVEITNNISLQNISGLGNLSAINGSTGIGTITINGNPLVTDLSVLNQITSVDYITIQNSRGLKDLSGLKNLQSVTHVMHLENDSGLVDLSGIEKLNTVGKVEIFNNTGIVSLKGLNGLTKITQSSYSIAIARNNSLQSLRGLENLISAIGSVQIFSNPVLTDFCPLKKLFNNGYNQWFTATYNALNPSQADIVANCP